MALDCPQCMEFFSRRARYKDTQFEPEELLITVAQGCEVCSILRNALEQLAEFSPDYQTSGPETQRILYGKAKITAHGTLQPSGRIKSGAYEFLFYYQQGITPLICRQNLSFKPAAPKILVCSAIPKPTV